MGKLIPEKLSKKELLEEYLLLKEYSGQLFSQVMTLENEVSELKKCMNHGYISTA